MHARKFLPAIMIAALLIPMGVARAAGDQNPPNDLPGAIQQVSDGLGASSAEGPRAKTRDGAPTLEEATKAVKDARRAKAASARSKEGATSGALGEAVARNRATLDAALQLNAPTVPSAINPDVTRMSGANRYYTASLLGLTANDGYNLSTGEGAPIVFLATGMNYPDALAASAWQVPILLTQRTMVPPETMAALSEIDPDWVVILGGPGAVSEAVEDYLRQTIGANIDRVNGANRYETAAMINYMWSTPCCGTVYLATGENFPDALASGPPAGYENATTVLARQNSLPADTTAAFLYLSPEQVVLQGGPGALSEAVRVSAGAFAVSGAIRRAGADRYSTAVESGRTAFTHVNSFSVFLATGTNYPDALAAGPAAFWWNGPVLLMKPNCIPSVVDERISELEPLDLIIVGGPGAIAEGAWDRVC